MFVNLFIDNLHNTFIIKDHIEDSLKPECLNGRTLDFVVKDSCSKFAIAKHICNWFNW